MQRDDTRPHRERRGKNRRHADGTRVGTVVEVRDGQGYVEPDDDADLTEVVRSMLNWDDADNTHELRNDDVETVTDDEVRLRSR